MKNTLRKKNETAKTKKILDRFGNSGNNIGCVRKQVRSGVR